MDGGELSCLVAAGGAIDGGVASVSNVRTVAVGAAVVCCGCLLAPQAIAQLDCPGPTRSFAADI